MKTKKNLIALAAIFGAACAQAEAPIHRADLAAALRDFLAQRGDMCLAKYDWPIDVSARDVAQRTRDALQLPVLQQEGLVQSRDGYVIYKTEGQDEESVPTQRYELTALGRKFYKVRETVSHPNGAASVVHYGDLCAGRLELDAITSITPITEPPAVAGGMRRASVRVSYLYRFKPAPWAEKEAVRGVFPMLDMLVRMQGKTPMTQSFHLDEQGKRWVADTQLD